VLRTFSLVTDLGLARIPPTGRLTVTTSLTWDYGVEGLDSCAVLIGLVLNAWAGWWWADPVAGYVLLYYANREARDSVSE
jgi:divalent metal cation (Fe/Co/Zn/Cd) transporter